MLRLPNESELVKLHLTWDAAKLSYALDQAEAMSDLGAAMSGLVAAKPTQAQLASTWRDYAASLKLPDGTPGAQYLVQAATNLTPPVAWVNVSTNTAGADGQWTYTDSSTNHTRRFYRAAMP